MRTWKKRTALALACMMCAVLCVSPLMINPPAETVQAATPIIGDVDQSGALNMRDALMLFSYSSGRDVIFTVAQLKVADMDDDGSVSLRDALMLYQKVSGRDKVPTTTTVPSTTTTTTTTTVTETTTTTTTVTNTGTDSGIMTSTVPTTPTTAFGVDVSYAQGSIDWAAIAASDAIDFAILRCGYGQDQTNQDDSRWEENVAACEKYDIPYGAYFFCYARTADEARGEAKHALRLLEGKNPDLPIFLDLEDSSWQGVLTNAQYAEIATIFCETLRAEGYRVGVYSNLYWWTTRLTDDCFNNWYRWVAQYNSECEYTGDYQLWQYSENGSVEGIEGPVDVNYCYVDPQGIW